MRDAVRRAAITPQAAEMAHEAGITRVGFTFLNGAVSNISIVASSGFPLLDDAAMQAVREARYPVTPATMRGQAEAVQVDVIFHASATDVDSD
jgi:protein TonB